MSDLAALFKRYCQAIDLVGVKTHHRLSGPASTQELDRLAERLGMELPSQLREWFDIFNGLDYATEPMSAQGLIPFHIPRSVQETIDALDHWQRESQADILRQLGSDDLVPKVFAPILADETGWESALFVDCSDTPGRVVTYATETQSSTGGFYHHSLSAMVSGALENVHAGYYGELYGNPHPSHTARHLSTGRGYAALTRINYGFSPDGPAPPRLGNRGSGQWAST